VSYAHENEGNQGKLTTLTKTSHSSRKKTTICILSFSRKEAEELKLEVAKWRVAEAAARDKLLSITQLNQSIAVTNATTHAQQNLVQSSPTSTRTLSPPPVREVAVAFVPYRVSCDSIDRSRKFKNRLPPMNGLLP
jgi:hypothetical protein